MTSQTPDHELGLELAEPMMLQWLSMLGVDVEYVQGEGNTLHFVDAQGARTSVIDYAGGYGALIFGHNHPEIVATAKEFLEAGTPVLAQASRQAAASRLAATLSTIVGREFGVDEPYYSVFSNSGAESVEVALKHAEFDRVLKIQELGQDIAAHVEAAGTAVRDAVAKVTDTAFEALGVPPDERSADLAGFERLAAAVERTNAERTARPPVFVTLEGSFHGKLIGSVQLTHNASFRTPFAAMAPQARFVPFDRPEVLEEIFAQERGTVFDLVVEAGEIRAVEREFPVFGAFVFEVIQGEGGIRVVGEELAARIQRACASVDCPIVIDEIQSGMGRTGAFFASSLIGLRADYYTLAKSLGGGIAKTAVTLIGARRYRHEFELVHSSTFAKDTFSSTLALKVLEMLEAGDGEAYRLARAWGERLTALFTSLREEFPDVVKDVRGKGLMLGLELHDQSGSAKDGIRQAALSDTFGYVVSGYLFRAHRIRTFPTASAVNTLRFEPSVLLTDAEVERLEVALRELCGVLRDQDEQRFFGA